MKYRDVAHDCLFDLSGPDLYLAFPFVTLFKCKLFSGLDKISPDFDLHACGPISHIKAGPCTRKFILFNRGECPTAENFFYVDKTYGFILRVIVLIGVLVVFNFSDVPLDVPFLLGGTFDSPTFTLHSER